MRRSEARLVTSHYSGAEGAAQRCHRACVEVTPSIGNASLPVLFPKEPVPASYPPR